MKDLLWFLIVLGVAGGAQWYYPNKYDPQIASLQAQVDKAAQEHKEAVVAIDQATRDKDALAKQLEASISQYEKKLSLQALQITDLTTKLQNAQKPVVSVAPAPQIIVAQEPQQKTVEMPDGSIVVVKSQPSAPSEDTQRNAQLQAKLASDQAALNNVRFRHDKWHGRGDIPDDISEAAVDALERQVRLDEAGLGN